MSAVRDRVLAGVRAGDITRSRRGHQWWQSETESRTLTTTELKHLRALRDEGLVRFETAGGYPNYTPIGAYYVTHLAPAPVGSDGGSDR